MCVSVGPLFFRTLGRTEDTPLHFLQNFEGIAPNPSQVTRPDMSAHGCHTQLVFHCSFSSLHLKPTVESIWILGNFAFTLGVSKQL